MAVSRRRFLQQGALAAAACAASSLPAFALQHPTGGDQLPDVSQLPSSGGGWQDRAANLAHINRAMFSSAVGTSFQVLLAPGAQPVWLTLLSVTDLPALAPANPASFAVANKRAAIAPSSSGFVLRFGSSAEIQQGSYLFQHDGLGSLALFIVPAPLDQGSYFAVVNRLENADAFLAAAPLRGAAAKSIFQDANAWQAGANAPATSSETETPLLQRAESPAARRAAARD